jgi:hypothetical protein
MFTMHAFSNVFGRSPAEIEQALAIGGHASRAGTDDGQFLYDHAAAEYLSALWPMPLPSAARVVEPFANHPDQPAAAPSHVSRTAERPALTWRMNGGSDE